MGKPMSQSSLGLMRFEKRAAFAWSQWHLESSTDRLCIRWRWNVFAPIAHSVKNSLDLFEAKTRKRSSSSSGMAFRAGKSRYLLHAERTCIQNDENGQGKSFLGIWRAGFFA